MGRLVKVAVVADVAPGEGKVVDAEGVEIALFNVDGAFHAIGNTCCHRGGPLGEGSLEGKTVTCPWHGWEYDVTTGETMMDPSASVPVYRTEVRGGDVFVELS